MCIHVYYSNRKLTRWVGMNGQSPHSKWEKEENKWNMILQPMTIRTSKTLPYAQLCTSHFYHTLVFITIFTHQKIGAEKYNRYYVETRRYWECTQPVLTQSQEYTQIILFNLSLTCLKPKRWFYPRKHQGYKAALRNTCWTNMEGDSLAACNSLPHLIYTRL